MKLSNKTIAALFFSQGILALNVIVNATEWKLLLTGFSILWLSLFAIIIMSKNE